MFVDGHQNMNLSIMALTVSGMAEFRGLSFSTVSASVRLRFCASRMRIDDSFSEATTIIADSAAFDISSEAHEILLERHPVQSLSQDSAGDVFAVQPIVRMIDDARRNATWCGAPYRIPNGKYRMSEIYSNASIHSNSSKRFSTFDRDGTLPPTSHLFLRPH